MKSLRLVCFALMILVAGCATLSERDRQLLQDRRVSDAVYDKMLHREPLDLPDIIELSRRKVPTPFVLRYLRSSSAVYTLGSADVARLRKAGVGAQIVDYMLATPRLTWAPYPPYWDPYYYPYGPWYGGYGPYIGVRPYFGHWHRWR